MFKSRRSSAPTVSPLAPPPASTLPPHNQQYQQQQQQYSSQHNQHHPHPHSGRPYPNQHPSYNHQQHQHMSLNDPNSRRSPAAAGDDLSRIRTNGTMDNGSVSSKGEKRRSFFGLGGKKDKDKHKEREKEKEERLNEPRSSFSVDRSRGNRQSIVGADQQRHPEPAFFPPPDMADRYPIPQSSSGQPNPSYRQGSPRESGQPSPPIQPVQSPVGRVNDMGGQRVVSSPQPRSNEFGAGAPHGMTKSQTMGFNQPRSPVPNVPETHPYRGFLNGQQGDKAPLRENSNGSVPRSNSMPLNQLNGQGARSPPPVEKETMGGSPTIERITSAEPGVGVQPWMKQFDPIVELIGLQPQKTYVASPPELEMILARTSAGGQPKQGQPGSVSNDWDSVWLQLSGISLSMWSMKETRAAAAKGEKVPPTYFNITDSSLELLAPLPPPPHRPNSHPHHFVFSLNTAGSNRLLFSSPSERDLARWSTGLRLAAWERARLEEIYTGHLVKLGGREPKSELVKGRMEGWVRVRVMGGTDWKRLWVVLSTPSAPEDKEDDKKHRRRSFFGLGEKEKEVVQEPNTGVSMASFYLEPRTIKNKTSVAVLTITNVTQAYAVFPERLDVMSQSNLLKVVGRIGGELVTIEGRLRDSGWALIMPESPESGTDTAPTKSPLSNMMRWVTGIHDVFGLYGRPERYNWNVKDPRSLFFAYPHGQDRARLFLDIEEAMASDFRLANLPSTRQQFCKILEKKMNSPIEKYANEEDGGTTPTADNNFRLPPLQFGESASPVTSHDSQPRSLTPITERTDIASRTNSTKTASSTFFMNDRKVSDGTNKQNSGGSSKHPQGEDRLAPISDSTETFGHFTEEPTEQIHPMTTPTTNESATAPSTWSQLSGETPTPGITPGVTPNERVQPVFPLPPVTEKSTGANGSVSKPMANEERDLPDLPSQSAHSGASPQNAASLQSTRPLVISPKAATQPLSPTHTSQRPPAAQPAQPAAQPAAQPDAQVPAPIQPSVVAQPAVSQPVVPPTASQSVGPSVVSPQPKKGAVEPSSSERSAILHDEPAALYLMNMVDEQPDPAKVTSGPSQALPPTVDSRLGPAVPASKLSPSPERPRIITSFDQTSKNEPLGRKPSGARAIPPKKGSTHSARNLESISDSASPPTPPAVLQPEGQPQKTRMPSTGTMSDLQDDAAQYLAFAEAPSPAKKPVAPPMVVPPPKQEAEVRSSFTPSRVAEERRAKAQQAAMDKLTARTVPGGGKRTAASTRDEWSGSEEEDEPEPEEENSPVVQQKSQVPQQPSSDGGPVPIQRVVSQTRALPPVPRLNGDDFGGGNHRESQYSQYNQPAFQQRDTSGFSVAPDRPRSHSPAAPHRGMQQNTAPAPPAQRQTMWNANFSAEHGLDQNKSGKFVDLEEPSVQLTKAFAPHGLLQAGMQDKEDRSAKKQEEVARETGSSLINVPSKPPPPQSGLLGAVAAHEKDRKNPGGIGATLTDREREKRLGEERQREIEKLQRQQMEHMATYGDPNMGQQQQGFGQFPYAMPPNMGMMGMPAMGFNPYQGGYNPYAQQQAMMAAQMAYHQAMMMSQAGSQVGGPTLGSPDRPSSPAGSIPGMPNPTQSPGPYGAFFPQGYPYMGGGMGMPWSASPPPQGMMPNMTGGSWLQPPGMGNQAGGGSDEGSRSRVHSMISDSGVQHNGPVN